MIEIDGSFGEGGGQILRTSLSMSIITGKPFHIKNIRAGRKKPGLLAQHLTSIRAAAEISQAELEGDNQGSAELHFHPQSVKSGEYQFDVGTAGSCTLVLQTILPALIVADSDSALILKGGTHNPFAPPFDFLAGSFLPIIKSMGPEVKAVLKRPGFYPIGGGRIKVKIKPSRELRQINYLERGAIKKVSAKAMVSKLPRNIAERELKVVKRRLSIDSKNLHIEEISNPRGPGNALIIEIESDCLTELFTGFGEKGVAAEKVAENVVKEAKGYIQAGMPVGQYLADQLLIPAALAGGGKFRTMFLTEHALTNMEVIKRFADIDFKTKSLDRDSVEVEVIGKVSFAL
jgi:RNA 3'-terminal phosphate cyclase (ATP)